MTIRWRFASFENIFCFDSRATSDTVFIGQPHWWLERGWAANVIGAADMSWRRRKASTLKRKLDKALTSNCTFDLKFKSLPTVCMNKTTW